MRYLAGYLLTFAGLGWVVLCLTYAGRFPATPFWVFLCAALAGAVPLMVIGGRLGHRGTLPAGAGAEEKRAEYRKDTFRVAVVLGWLFAWGFLGALPVVVIGAGWLPRNPNAVAVWFGAVAVGSGVTARLLYPALERRALAWWSGGATGPAGPPAPRRSPVNGPVARRVLPRTRPTDPGTRVE